jgi:hypothetical protein
MTRGTGSNLPVPANNTIFATPRARGGGHWLSSILPWWGWVALALIVIPSFGIGAIVAFFQALAGLGTLLGLTALGLLVGGIVWAALGLCGRAVPHTAIAAGGHHMFRNGLLAAAFGGFLLLGGLNVVWGVSSVVVHDVTTTAKERFKYTDAPGAIQVSIPSLAGATSPAPATPRP